MQGIAKQRQAIVLQNLVVQEHQVTRRVQQNLVQQETVTSNNDEKSTNQKLNLKWLSFWLTKMLK